MAVELNHTIIWAKDKWASSQFLAYILGVEAGPQWARFVPVRVGGVTLDFADSPERHYQHYGFLVDEEEFDAVFAPLASLITPSTTAAARARSTITTAGAASISTHPTATCSS